MKLISNWNNFPIIEAEVKAPNFSNEIEGLLNAASPTIARGNGRCYVGASLGANVLSTQSLNHALSFDEISVAWIDCLKRGKSFGRSILMMGVGGNITVPSWIYGLSLRSSKSTL